MIVCEKIRVGLDLALFKNGHFREHGDSSVINFSDIGKLLLYKKNVIPSKWN